MPKATREVKSSLQRKYHIGYRLKNSWIVNSLPEDWRSDLEELRHHWYCKKIPRWMIRLKTAKCLVEMMGANASIKLQDFSLHDLLNNNSKTSKNRFPYIKGNLLAILLIFGTSFSTLSLPLLMLGNKSIDVRLRGEVIFAGQLRDIAHSYLILVSIGTTVTTVSTFALMNHFKKKRKIRYSS